MKAGFFLILIGVLLISPAFADGNVTNTTNVTPMEPVILSFMGGHMFGENPVQIIDNKTGRIAFVGDTGSKWINLTPGADRGYIIRVEPAGISDAANSPDAGVIGAMKWVERNPFGTFVYSILIAGILIALKKWGK